MIASVYVLISGSLHAEKDEQLPADAIPQAKMKPAGFFTCATQLAFLQIAVGYLYRPSVHICI